jgi:hypothetical protein
MIISQKNSMASGTTNITHNTANMDKKQWAIQAYKLKW